MTYHEQVRAFKIDVLTETLVKYGGHRGAAALELGLAREYLYRLMRDLGVDVPPKYPKLGRRPVA